METTPDSPSPDEYRAQATRLLDAVPGVRDLRISVTAWSAVHRMRDGAFVQLEMWVPKEGAERT